MRLLATVLTLAALFVSGQTNAASAKQEKGSCKAVKSSVLFNREKTWNWQERLVVDKTRASLTAQQIRSHKACGYLRWVSELWQKRRSSSKERFSTYTKSPESMTAFQLYDTARYEIATGGIYSSRWGDASPRLKAVCYELINRAFAPFRTQSWARYVVNRESGCNPGAINSSSGTTGIAQIHPDYHKQFDYHRMKFDMRYAIASFVRMSNGGRYTGPWCLC